MAMAMACFGRDRGREKTPRIGCFERSSPALQQILLQLCRAETPMEIDHHLYEFGSVEYHIESSASDSHIYLSISTPILSPKTLVSEGLCPYTMQKVKDICPNVVDIVDPAKEGFQLTVRLNIAHIPQGKDGIKIIKEIAAIESVILSSQLKEMLRKFSPEGTSQGTYKPIKFTYHPSEPIFVIRQPHKMTVVFPMRFKETSDVVIATSFFQELMDVGSSEEWAKTPPCTWSPVPPAELRGEAIEDLSTNGGFVSFDIFPRHMDEKRLDNTVWNLLNFNAYVKSHVKCTKGFIHRKMRKRLEDLVKILHQTSLHEDENRHEVRGCGWTMNPVSSKRLKKLGKRYTDFSQKISRTRYRIKAHGVHELKRKIKRIHHRIKIHSFANIRRRWFPLPKFRSAKGYTRLD